MPGTIPSIYIHKSFQLLSLKLYPKSELINLYPHSLVLQRRKLTAREGKWLGQGQQPGDESTDSQLMSILLLLFFCHAMICPA